MPGLAKKILLTSVSVIVGLVFLFSAYTKLYPIEYFEYTFVDLGFANWVTAPFFARLLIGLEAFTGVLFLAQVRLKKLALPLAAILLVVFSLHLGGQILLNGNKGNCGCFGNYLFMTPAEALIKNMVLLAMVFIIWRFYSFKGWQLPWFFMGGIVLTCGSLPFVLNPVDMFVSASHGKEAVNYKLDLHWLYESPTDGVPSVNLNEGKHIVAFLSLTCPHCRLAAYKLHVMHKRNPSLPVFFVINGDNSEFADFYNETKANDIPHVLFRGSNFLKMSGPELPTIVLLEDGKVVKKENYMLLTQESIEQWLAEKK